MQGLGGVLVVNVHMQETPSPGWILLFEAGQGTVSSMDVPAPVNISATHEGKAPEKTNALLWSHLCFCVDAAENNHLFIALFFLLKSPLPTKGRYLSGKADVSISGFQELVWEMKWKSYWFSLWIKPFPSFLFFSFVNPLMDVDRLQGLTEV